MDQEILYRYLKGQTTSSEEVLIMRWLDENPVENQKKLDRVRFIFEGMELYGNDIASVETERQVPHWWRIARRSLRAAAVVAAILAGGYAAHRYTLDSLARQTTLIEVPFGQRIGITLPDSSHVWLNSGAKLEYPVVFRKNLRSVNLSGEAVFDVRHDRKRPFEVETFATRIRVLGTRFNVDADSEHQRFTAALLEGEIKISNRIDPDQPDIRMKPGDMIRLSDGALSAYSSDTVAMTCWIQGLIDIRGLSFSELMSKFEQVFDVRIVVERPSMPRIGNVSGKIRVNDGVGNALRILQYTADFDFERNDELNVIRIF